MKILEWIVKLKDDINVYTWNYPTLLVIIISSLVLKINYNNILIDVVFTVSYIAFVTKFVFAVTSLVSYEFIFLVNKKVLKNRVESLREYEMLTLINFFENDEYTFRSNKSSGAISSLLNQNIIYISDENKKVLKLNGEDLYTFTVRNEVIDIIHEGDYI